MPDEEKNIEQTPVPQQPVEHVEAAPEAQESVEREQLSHDDTAALREEIEKTDIDDSLKLQVTSHAQAIQDVPETERVQKLIEIAGSRGIAYAVHVARKAGDAYLVDALHDALADGGYYKKFKI